jgi:hypothetical protein
MAKKRKKKKSGGFSRPLSPESYIRKQANQLPIYKVLITRVWREAGEANVVVARQHKTGNITSCYFLVDLHCMGVKDTTFQFNTSLREFSADLERFMAGGANHEIPYPQAHAIIYGAVAFARSLGLQPHPDFRISRGILAPDDADMEPYQVAFGHHGRPVLHVMPGEKLSHVIATLDRTVGPDNYDILGSFDEDDDDDYGIEEVAARDPFDWKDEEWKTFLANMEEYTPWLTARAMDALYNRTHGFSFDMDEWGEKLQSFMPLGFKAGPIADTDTPPSGLGKVDLMAAILDLDDIVSESPEDILKFLAGRSPDYWLTTLAVDRLYKVGAMETGENLAEKLFGEYPELLIAKLTLARFKLQKGDLKWVKEQFGPRFYMSDIAPDRQCFAAIEVTRLLDVAIHYYTLVGEYDTASMYHNWLWDMGARDSMAMMGCLKLAQKRSEAILSNGEMKLRSPVHVVEGE